jgi:hypothetical protein
MGTRRVLELAEDIDNLNVSTGGQVSRVRWAHTLGAGYVFDVKLLHWYRFLKTWNLGICVPHLMLIGSRSMWYRGHVACVRKMKNT